MIQQLKRIARTLVGGSNSLPTKSRSAPTDFQEDVSLIDEHVLRALRASPATELIEEGPAIAHYLDQPVPAWFIDAQGRRFEFHSICVDPLARPLREGEALVPPGLIYVLDAPDASESGLELF